MSTADTTAHRRLRHGAALSLPGTVLPGIASYLAFVLIAQIDSDATLGYVSLGWVVANTGSAVVALGPAHTALRSITAGQDELIVRARFRWLVLVRSLMLAGLLALLGTILWSMSGQIGTVLILAAPWTFGQCFILYETETLKATEQFGLISLILGGRAVLGWALAVIGAAVKPSLVGIILPTAAVGVGIAAIVSRCRFARPTLKDRELDRSIGRPIAQMSVASYALGYGDYFVVQAILGPSAVGIYNLAYQLGSGTMELLSTPITTVALPRVVSMFQRAGAGRDEARSTAVRLAAVVAAITVIIPVCFIALIPTGIFELISSDPLLPIIAAIVAVAIGFQSFTRLGYGFLLAHGSTRTALVSFVVASVVNIGASAALTWTWGLTGTAVATVIGYGLLAVITIWTVKRL